MRFTPNSHFVNSEGPSIMKEIAEFRVDERFASLLLGDDEGERLRSGMIRRVEFDSCDPRYNEVGHLQSELHSKHGKPFFYGWDLRYVATPREIQQARLFRARITSVFEPAGEECGTEYDESTACTDCGAGATLVEPLVVDLKRIPKGKDFAKTIAGEVVVSRRVLDCFEHHSLTGANLSPLGANRSSSVGKNEWFHLTIASAEAEIVAPTRVGINPFDDDLGGECRCRLGDLLGLNLLSLLSIGSKTRSEADIESTRQYIGVRRGLLRPERQILVSPTFRRLIESEKLKGLAFEIAYLVQ